MMIYYVISAVTLAGLFILFLVLGKTLNNVINQLLKLEYMLQKELEFRQEEKEITRLIDEKMKSDQERANR
jgi:uncharacterized protein (DUF3084 family)